MWVIDLIIEKQRMRRLKRIPHPNPTSENRSRLTHLNIDRFLKRQEERRIKERR